MEQTSEEVLERLSFMKAAGLKAAQSTLHFFQNPELKVDVKADESPVTVADRQAEEMLRAAIEKSFANDGIVGEEFGHKPGVSGFHWIIDPIDGTKSFIHGVPLYGTLVGLANDRRVVAGAIFMPALNEYIYAAEGHGAWIVKGDHAARRIHVSDTKSLSDSLFATTSLDYFAKENKSSVYLSLCERSAASRGWSDCYALYLAAQGAVDVVVEPELCYWDWAAAKPIIEEAGGLFLNWQGNVPKEGSTRVVVCNKHLASEVVDVIRESDR